MNPGGLQLVCATTSAQLFSRGQSSMGAGIKQHFFDDVIKCALNILPTRNRARAMKTVVSTTDVASAD